MKDRYNLDVQEGDVIQITSDKNPHGDTSKIFKVETISKTIKGKECLYVDGADLALYAEDLELYAIKIA